MTSELHRPLAHALTEDRLRRAHDRQLTTLSARPPERDVARSATSTPHRRWVRRLRRAVLAS
jgi:hypothetical protein